MDGGKEEFDWNSKEQHWEIKLTISQNTQRLDGQDEGYAILIDENDPVDGVTIVVRHV